MTLHRAGNPLLGLLPDWPILNSAAAKTLNVHFRYFLHV